MKKTFLNYFFSTVVFLGGFVQLYAKATTDADALYPKIEGQCHVNFDTFDDEFLPLSSSSKFDLKKLIAEIVEGEELETGSSNQKNNSHNFKDRISAVFFYAYYQNSILEHITHRSHYHLQKRLNNRKIYIQFEVFRL